LRIAILSDSACTVQIGWSIQRSDHEMRSPRASLPTPGLLVRGYNVGVGREELREPGGIAIGGK